jgi:hypothetical protein
MFPLMMGGTAMPGLMQMQGGYGADPRQQQQPMNWGTFMQRYFGAPQGDRSDQGRRGNQGDPGNPMAAGGPQGGPGPDPRAPSPPDQNYDPNTVKQRNNMLNMGAIGMQMLQPRQMGAPAPWLQIGSKRYG